MSKINMSPLGEVNTTDWLSVVNSSPNTMKGKVSIGISIKTRTLTGTLQGLNCTFKKVISSPSRKKQVTTVQNVFLKHSPAISGFRLAISLSNEAQVSLDCCRDPTLYTIHIKIYVKYYYYVLNYQ